MTDVQKLSVVWHFSRTQVPGELLPPVGLLQVEIPDNGNAKCGHSCCRKLAVTNRAPEEYQGILRAVSRSTITTTEIKQLEYLIKPLFLHFSPWAHSQRSSDSRVENWLIVALQSGWES